MSADVHFQRRGWFTGNVINRGVTGLNRAGISVAGTRVLEVPGRTSGQLRRTPVNLLTVDGERYLVAPRGQTQWVRNLRASGRGRLLLGKRGEPFTATEVPDGEKTPRLRAYLKRWRSAVGMFFDGVGPPPPPTPSPTAVAGWSRSPGRGPAGRCTPAAARGGRAPTRTRCGRGVRMAGSSRPASSARRGRARCPGGST